MPSLYAVMSEEKDRQSERIRKLQEENKQLKNICKNLINEVNKRGITVTMSDSCRELLE